MDMSTRHEQLSQLEACVKDFNAEVTMILQSLQWDRKHLLEKKAMVVCKYDHNHRVPLEKLVEHEKRCFLKSQGYSKEDCLLPDLLDPDAPTVVKLSTDNIADILEYATRCNPSLKKGAGSGGCEPLTLERLQASYSADERCAIHDAVVTRVPSCHDLSDLALPSSSNNGQDRAPKTKLEILAELRNMKRRRAKYRVAAKTRNYSDVLRDVISSQMEMYTGAKDNQLKEKKCDARNEDNNRNDDHSTKHRDYEGHRSKATEEKYGRSDEGQDRKRKYEDAYMSERIHTSSHRFSIPSTSDRERYRSHDKYDSKNSERSSRGEKSYKKSSDHDRKSERKYDDDYRTSSEKRHSHKHDSDKKRNNYDESHSRSKEHSDDKYERDSEHRKQEKKKLKEKDHSANAGDIKGSEAHTNVDIRKRAQNVRENKSHESNKDKGRETSEEKKKDAEKHVSEHRSSKKISRSSEDYRKSEKHKESRAYSSSYKDKKRQKYDKKDKTYDKYAKPNDTKRIVKDNEIDIHIKEPAHARETRKS